VADLVRRLIEPGVPVVHGAARPATTPSCVPGPGPARPPRVLGRTCRAANLGDLQRHTGSKRMSVRTVSRLARGPSSPHEPTTDRLTRLSARLGLESNARCPLMSFVEGASGSD
jgi:hypothetical protein